MVMIFAVMLLMNLLQIDETYHLPMLYGGLPLRRRTVIAAHYLVAAIVLVVLTLAGLALVLVGSLAGWGREPEGIGSVAGMTLVMAFMVALILPLTLRFGVQRSPLLLMAAMVVLVTIVGGFPVVRDWLAAGAAWVTPLSPVGSAVVGAAAVGFALPASYLVSARIYERQDH